MLTCKEWQQFALDKQLEFLGEGIEKTVYALNKHTVLKLGRINDGQCNHEAKYWDNASPRIRKHLAKVFCHGDGWSIQERADKTFGQLLREEGFDRWYETSPRYQKAKEQIRRSTGSMFIDLHADNIGVFGDKLKLIDYGI